MTTLKKPKRPLRQVRLAINPNIDLCFAAVFSSRKAAKADATDWDVVVAERVDQK